MMSDNEPSFVDMIRIAREGKEYLSFIDLPEGTRATVTIEKIIRKTNVKSAGGRTVKVVDFIQFKGKEKLLWLSLGKLKSRKTILGSNAADWKGKDIVLFADPSVKMSGSVVGGLVIEPCPKSK